MVFAGYRITAHGTDLIELVVPLREQRVIGLRALPVGYGDDHRREKTRITALMIEESDKALEISPNHLKG